MEASYICISPLATSQAGISAPRCGSNTIWIRLLQLYSVAKVSQVILMEFTTPDWHTDSSPRGFCYFKQEDGHVAKAIFHYVKRPKARPQEKQRNQNPVLKYSKDYIFHSFIVLTLPLCVSLLNNL